MPVLTPAELWQKSGRYRIPEVFKLTDRGGRPFVLAMTHEETITFHARELRSYRDLPKILYHFQTKGRDEPRPRGGLLRVREFVMKDAYSFDRDEEGLDGAFRAHAGAYERIFERCGLDVVAVEAESGMMGGTESVDYLAPSGSGENTLVTCERGDYAADLEIARGVPRAAVVPGAARRARRGRDAGDHDLRGPRGLPRHRPRRDVEGDAGRGRRQGRARARPRRRPPRRGEARRRRGERRAAGDRWTRSSQAFGAEPGSLGPVGFGGEIVLDETLREGQFVAGANRTGYHLRGVEHGRDFEARAADIRIPREGDVCPRCGGALALSHRDRGRSHLQARDDLLRPARREVPRRAVGGAPDRDGELRHRPGARPRGHRRAAPRRAGNRLAGVDRSVRRARPGARGRVGRGRGARVGARRRPLRRAATTSSSTIATHGPGRSSRTPICSAARRGSPSGGRAWTTARSTSAVGRTRPTRAFRARL